MQLLEKMLDIHKTERQHQHVALYRDIMEYYRYNLTPEQAFGISMGLGFEYTYEPNFKINSDYTIPGLYIGGYFSKDRRKLAKNLRIWLDIYRGEDEKKGFQYIVNYLRMGRPVIVEVNLDRYWEYLQNSVGLKDLNNLTHLYDVPNYIYLNGFMINVIGYNEEQDELICQDSHLENILRIPRKIFNEMCFYRDDIIRVEGEWTLIVVPRHKNIVNIEIAVIDSIRLCVHEMINPYKMDKGYVIGLDGLKKLLNHFKYWDEILTPDQLKTTIKMIYFNAEIAAGSTGLYRKTYADFLKTSSKILKSENLKICAELYRKVGSKWSLFLGAINNYAKDDSVCFKDIQPKAQLLLQEVVDMENKAIISLSDALKVLY